MDAAAKFIERMVLGRSRTHRVLGKEITIHRHSSGLLVIAAGLAVGAYEAWKSRDAGGDRPPPPTPELVAHPIQSEPVLRLVRLMISAARADGHLDPGERERILAEARAAGAEEMVAAELESPVPLSEIVGDVSDPALKEQLYTLAFGIVHAEQGITGGERIYLLGLAQQLGLDPRAVSRLESEATASTGVADAPE
jgi:uncharacterized membrane protein YebE (DUF533 family)